MCVFTQVKEQKGFLILMIVTFNFDVTIHVHIFFVIFYVIAEKILYLTNPTNLLHTHFHLFKIIHLLFNRFNYSFAIKSNLLLLLTNLSYLKFRRMNRWLKLNEKLISSLLF